MRQPPWQRFLTGRYCFGPWVGSDAETRARAERNAAVLSQNSTWYLLDGGEGDESTQVLAYNFLFLLRFLSLIYIPDARQLSISLFVMVAWRGCQRVIGSSVISSKTECPRSVMPRGNFYISNTWSLISQGISQKINTMCSCNKCLIILRIFIENERD